MRDWSWLAKVASMKYMMMTTKLHEGFFLWDSEQTDYNAACRELVGEFVEACRDFESRWGSTTRS